jgi:4-oxalocrotonate tautomerase
MPFVNIRVVDGVLGDDAAEKKAVISRRVTEVLSSAAGIPEDYVWVVFEDVPATEWYVGGKSVAQSKAED